jgi:TonB family protein
MATGHMHSTARIALLIVGVQAYAQLVAPAVIQRVEPVYSTNPDNLVLDPTIVKLVVDERGDLYSVDSVTSLPDNVVQALSKWKFRPGTKDGKPVAITVTTSIPVRRPANELVQRAMRPWVKDELDGQAPDQAGLKLTADAALRLEQKLKDSADSAASRATLLRYAARKVGIDKTAPQLQSRQVSWFVRNRPGTALLVSPPAMLFKVPGDFQNVEGYEEVRALWLKRLSENSDDPVTIGHATYFLRLSDAELVERLLLASIPGFGSAAVWLGELYGVSALGVTRFDLANGLPAEAGATLPDAGFGRHARSALESTDDVRVLLGALDIVNKSGGSLAAGSAVPAGYSDFCHALLAHAKRLYADATALCAEAATPALNPPEPMRNTKKTAPEYPSAAKARRVEGKVLFRGLIGRDGKITTLELLSAPLALYDSARSAVSKWEYQPLRLQGEPVEVVTDITVNYKLQ